MGNRHMFHAMAAVLAMLISAAAAAGPSCYRKVGAPIPEAKGATLFLVDTTTPRDTAALASLDALAQRVLRHKGEKILVASFAGLAPGEHPRIVTEVYQEPSADAAFQENQVIEKTEVVGRCLPLLWAGNIKAVQAALEKAVGHSGVNSNGAAAGTYSEIAFAMRWVVTDILPTLVIKGHAPTLRVVVFSDGYLHSRTGQSFYQAGRVRPIVAQKELAVLNKSGLAFPAAAKPVPFDLYWVGMGSTPDGRKEFASPADFEALLEFWNAAGKLYGAQAAWLGLTVRADAIR